MAGSKETGKKLRERKIAEFGSYEAYRQHMRKLGARGGQASNTGGFYGRSEIARQASKLGHAAKHKQEIDK